MIAPSLIPLSESDLASLRELTQLPAFLLLQSVLASNETLLCFEAASGVMKGYDAYLHTQVPERDQTRLFCEAARFRIATEVLGEISKGEKTIRALKPAT